MIPNKRQSKSVSRPHWITPFYVIILFLVVHVAAPWGLSLLSTHMGWFGLVPGTWNLLTLIVVIPAIAGTFMIMALHLLASPRSFLELRQTERLLASGPYAFSRNPMYLFELVFWFGWALFYGSITVLAGFIFWCVMFNFFIVPREELELQTRFGEAYKVYKAHVPRWLGLNR